MSLTAADHGYDNSLPSQRAFFRAFGPSFKTNYRMKGFSQLDIYPLMCHLLGIEPRDNNGSLAAVQEMLEEKDRFYVTAATCKFQSQFFLYVTYLY